MAGEVWFYHLERSGVEAVLADLLTRSLARGWRALVVSPDRERLTALDERLWTFADDSFLPHGLDDADHAERQPVLLTTSDANLNGAAVRVLLDGADPAGVEAFERTILLFDGADTAALAAARAQWTALKGAGAAVAYWRQKAGGGWERQV